MTKTKEWREKKRCLSFPPPWEFQTPVSTLRASDPFLLLGDPGLLINLPRNWLTSGGDGIPAELFQTLKYDAVIVLPQYVRKFGKLSSGHRTRKDQFSFQSQIKAIKLKDTCSLEGKLWQTHWKRPWCWERLKAGGEVDNRNRDHWMASPTRWTWVWGSSRSWWWTGKPAGLQSRGSQRVRHDWVTKHTFQFSSITQSYLTHCGHMDCSPPGPSVYGGSPGKIHG